MASQFLFPDSLLSPGGWTGDYSDLDEVAASDADFVYSKDRPNGSAIEIGLSNPASTPGGGLVTLNYRHAQVQSGVIDGGGSATTLDVSLYQGGTLIASDVQQAPGGAWATRSWQFDPAAVTDWTDLIFIASADGGGGGPSSRRGVALSWIRMEIPGAETIYIGAAGQAARYLGARASADLYLGEKAIWP